jgi:trk system potassium uptake protein TrkA
MLTVGQERTHVKILIVGAGMVGYSLAEHLSHTNNNVSVIDRSAEICKELNNRLDVFALNAAATDLEALEEAGIRTADMVIAVTPHDDTNLVVCNFAKQYGVAKRIARIKSTWYTRKSTVVSLEELGVTHVIEPEREVVRNILNVVELPGVTEAANFQSENVYLRGYTVTEDMPIAGRTVEQTTQFTSSAHILIVLIVRKGRAILPRGSQHILAGDEIVAIMPRDSFGEFRAMINKPAGKLKKIVVFGDSFVAVQLCEQLLHYSDRVILVDPDEKHAELAATQLKGVEVLWGDCTRIEMLQEVHVENLPFFIAAGNDTEDNVMSCLLAKAEGAREVIAISNAKRHARLFMSVGLDHIINPNIITAQTIIANIIKVPIGSMLKLKNVDVEVNRLVVGHNSAVVGRAIKEMSRMVKSDIIVGSIFRADELIIPSGETVYEEGDEVLILSRPQDSEPLQRLFRPRSLMSTFHA